MVHQKRGFGHWIGKPVVILEALIAAEPDDIVVYLDAGSRLNHKGRERFLEYVEIVADSRYRLLSFQNVHTENMWTKGDLARRLGVYEKPTIMSTSQLTAAFLLLSKTKSNIDLIRQWQEIAVEENDRYSDDTESIFGNNLRFKEHRHDQSISSLLRKMRGTETTHYEVQPYDWAFEMEKEKMPVLAERLKT